MAEANQNVLYVDEVNLLPDHLVDDLLDAAATKVNVIEREGISISHPSDFVLMGSMNPEEGELRPQLLDRFPLHVAIGHEHTVEDRMELVRRNLDFENNPDEFIEKWEPKQAELREQIVTARNLLSKTILSDAQLRAIAMATDALEVDGVRPDIIISKTAITLASFFGRTEVELEDMQLAAQLTLSHRTRRGGLLEPPAMSDITEAITRAPDVAQKQDRRKSPTQVAPEPDDGSGDSGKRFSGGKFGRQDTFATMDMGEEGKKKLRRK